MSLVQPAIYWNETEELGSVIDFEGIIIGVNSAHASQLGRQSSEIIGRSMYEFIYEDDHKKATEIFNQCIEHDGVKSAEVRVQAKNGTIIWIDVCIVVHRPTRSLYTMGRDITNFKETELILSQDRDILHLAIENVPSLVAIYSVESDPLSIQYLQVSDSYCETMGYSRSELLGVERSSVSLIRDIDDQEVLLAVVKSGKPLINREFEFLHKNGNVIHTELSVRKVVSTQGVFLISTAVELTHIKKVNKEIKDQNAKLEEYVAKLEMKSIALSEVVESMAEGKKRFESNLRRSIESQLEPLLNKIKLLPSVDSDIIENIESIAKTLNGVEQPNMEDAFLALTTNELSVVRSIQLGFSSKEIALKMNTSYGAVESSRKNIRKKLGLQHSSKNLKTFLMSCSNV